MPAELIDTNVSLGRWPFRRLALDDTPALVAKLRASGITQAWAGSYEALLHKDVAGGNLRLAAECAQHGPGFLLPFGCVNPALPGWEEDLRRCHEEFHMPGIRLHPNYHGYTLDAPFFARLLQLAAERKLLVQLALHMEDERTLHPLVNLPAVDVQPLAALLKTIPGLRLMLLNAFRVLRGKPVLDLVAAGNVSFEISTLEGGRGIENLLHQFPVKRLLFGSSAPFFYVEAALLKLQESELTEAQLGAVRAGNAGELIQR